LSNRFDQLNSPGRREGKIQPEQLAELLNYKLNQTMKQLLFTFLLLITVQAVQSQDTIVSYFDRHWKETDQANAVYFRKAAQGEHRSWTVKDYYRNGTLQMSGSYKTKKLKKKHGYFQYFYENGRVYYEGRYETDEFDGEWKWYREDGSLSSQEWYKEGVAVEFTFWNADGSKVEEERQILEMAEFKGGELGLRRYIAQNVRYPKQAQYAGMEGKVYVKFFIDTDGFVERARIEKSVDSDLDKEALRVVVAMPQWIPGTRHNLPARISYTVPINFVLK